MRFDSDLAFPSAGMSIESKRAIIDMITRSSMMVKAILIEFRM